MNKYVVLYSGSTIRGITPYVSLEIALEEAYLNTIGLPPRDSDGWIISTQTIIFTPFIE